MPQHKSAAKRVRQNERRKLRNRGQRSRMRTMMKKVRTATDKDEATELLNQTKALLDRLASKNIIHKNKAANYKRELDRHVQSL